MKHPATRQLFAYWNELRGERAAPERSEIDPASIREVLADSYMLDVDLDRRFPFRLAGTRVNGLVGTEQKGLSFLDLWRDEERRNIAAILMTVADGARPVVAGGVASPDGMSECAVELLFLPLRHHGKTHARILGLIKVTTKPVWLGTVAAWAGLAAIAAHHRKRRAGGRSRNGADRRRPGCRRVAHGRRGFGRITAVATEPPRDPGWPVASNVSVRQRPEPRRTNREPRFCVMMRHASRMAQAKLDRNSDVTSTA